VTKTAGAVSESLATVVDLTDLTRTIDEAIPFPRR
jgi:hypothetical protein